MIVPDGYSDVPAGKIAAVVTMLEMTAPPPGTRDAARQAPPDPAWDLRLVPRPDLAWYRDLFQRVGEEWLWFSRLRLSDAALAEAIRDPLVEIHALWVDGRAEGLLELSFQQAGECELEFLGLTRPLIGRGAGRWLMTRAIDLAWSHPIGRLWVRTCTLDHPGALAFYVRSGFRAFRRQIEVADDPRLIGLAPRTAAPHVPLLAVPPEDRS